VAHVGRADAMAAVGLVGERDAKGEDGCIVRAE
jgi:hypothetical protein